MFYETIDIDEFKNSIRREGTIMGVFTLVAVIGQAIAGQLGQQALGTIYSCVTLYPGIFLAFSLVFAVAYPVSRKKLDLFQSAADRKRNNLQYSTDGFEDIF